MNIKPFIQAKTGMCFLILVFAAILPVEAFSQNAEKVKTSPTPSATPASLPKVTQIDNIALKKLIKPGGKPLLINFWATWCDPCREEFPDLVKISADYKDKIDFITISMDDLAEINRDVPKFLAEMKAEMPAFLLKSQSEDAAIMTVSKNWQGALPFTILFDEKGETVYFRQGKVKIDLLRAALEKLQTNAPVAIVETTDLSGVVQVSSAKEGKEDAEKDIAKGILQIKRFGLTPAIPAQRLKQLKTKYNIEIEEYGCVLINTTPDYFKAYNETMRAEIKKRYSSKVLATLPR
ncbi:MAG: redoxin domain-containing protein [Pyrinomonadaceae bacterium]